MRSYSRLLTDGPGLLLPVASTIGYLSSLHDPVKSSCKQSSEN